MKSIFRNPLLYLSVFLFLLLSFQFVGFVQGQQGIWSPPSAPPPGGQPAAPLDTSTAGQTKAGDLNIAGNFIVSGDRGILVRKVDGNGIAINYVQTLTSLPQIDFKDDFGTGGIRLYNGQIQARDENRREWFTLGTGTGGTGGGGGLWQAGAGGNIYYTAGLVGIGTNNPKTRLHLKGTTAADLTLEYDGSRNFAAGGGVYFRTFTGGGSDMWRMGIFPAGYTNDGARFANAWYVKQKKDKSGNTVEKYRLLIRDDGFVEVGGSLSAYSLSLNAGLPGTDKYNFAPFGASLMPGYLSVPQVTAQSISLSELISPIGRSPRGISVLGKQGYVVAGGGIYGRGGGGDECTGLWGVAKEVENGTNAGKCGCENEFSVRPALNKQNYGVQVLCMYP